MASANGLPPVPPVTKDASDLAGSTWQRWFSQISGAIKSLIQTDQLNQFAGGAIGVGCYVTTANTATTGYSTGNSPRFVSVQVTLAAVSDGATLTVGGTIVSKYVIGTANSCTVTLCAIVPANTSYRLDTQGSAAIASWLEL